MKYVLKNEPRLELNINGVRYRVDSDFHTHTKYSHGKGTIEDNVVAALNRGLKLIAITDHGPKHLGYGVPRKKFAEMKAEIMRLRRKYPDIEILFGVEANIIAPDGTLDIKSMDTAYFDFICAGWHYGAIDGLTPAGILGTLGNLMRSSLEKATAAQIRRNTKAITRAIENGTMKFLTHPGDKAPVDMQEIAAACARTGTLLEINTNHMSLTPEHIRNMLSTDVRFIINSDAHSPDRVGDFLPAFNLLLQTGLEPERVVNMKTI